MDNKQCSTRHGRLPTLERSGIRRIIQVILLLVFQGVVLFVSAGRLDWIMGWVLIGLYILAVVFNVFFVFRKNPELINERGRLAENVKGWVKVLIAVSSPLPFVTLAVAGMDAVRFGWSNMPPALLASGIVLFVVGMFLFAWAMSSNKYFSTTVRIQYDRGHQTITSGPYQYVRHPGYMGSVLYTIGTPLLLGSWWALVPATLAIAAITVRTALEDDTLQQELVGYAEYTKKVRYRLLPGVW